LKQGEKWRRQAKNNLLNCYKWLEINDELSVESSKLCTSDLLHRFDRIACRATLGRMSFNPFKFLRSRRDVPSPCMWPIRRTKPIGVRDGFAIPIFIRNVEYHLTTVDAYSDGAIEVWGFVDRSLFEGKLRSGWVWPQPPDGATISIHNLGFCICRAGDWFRDKADIRNTVHEAIKFNNPTMTHLLEMGGSATEMRGNLSCAKPNLADDCPLRRCGDGSSVRGCEVPIFAVGDSKHTLTRAFVFADGTARIGAAGPLTTADGVFKDIDSGKLTTTIPNGARLEVEGLGSFTSHDASWFVKAPERVKELRDLVAQLAGKPAVVQLCREARQHYESGPTEARRKHLRDMYEAVPEHLRVYCGDMDSKDGPIKRILYGDSGWAKAVPK
jgi:hypothetical protein